MTRRTLAPLALAFAAGLLCGRPAPTARAQDAATVALVSSRAHHVALRLRPGQDLRQELLRVVEAEGLQAAAVVTCVGSLGRAVVRYADRRELATHDGHFEIVSLVGTLGRGSCHLHLSFADGEGRTIGGHLNDGSTVYTTAEVVLVSLDDLRFGRAPDPDTTSRELTIERRR